MKETLCAIVLLVLTLVPAPAIELVSVDEEGEQIFSAFLPDVSSDGRYLAFLSFVFNGVSYVSQVLVRDQELGTVTTVSVPTGSEDAANGNCNEPAISDDGRFVVFTSSATNLTPGDTNGVPDIFLHDLETSTTVRITAASAEAADFRDPAISGDGRFVAFSSNATDLVSGDLNGFYDIFVYNVMTTSITCESRGPMGLQANGHNFQPKLDADASVLVFVSQASNLAVEGDGAEQDIVIRDRGTGENEIGPRGPLGTRPNGPCYAPSISNDGRYIAFYTTSTSLVADPFPDSDSDQDVYVYDAQAMTTKRASLSSTNQDPAKSCFSPRISGNGRYVAFTTDASNVVPFDTNGSSDIFIRDMDLDKTAIVTVSSLGIIGNAGGALPVLNGDGSQVYFDSSSTNLVPGDQNGVGTDIYRNGPNGTTPVDPDAGRRNLLSKQIAKLKKDLANAKKKKQKSKIKAISKKITKLTQQLRSL